MLSHLLYTGFKVLAVLTLGHNAMQYGESQLMFARSISPPTSMLKSKPSKQSQTFCLPLTVFLLSLCFDPEDENDVPPKYWLIFSELHSIVFHETELFLLCTLNTSYNVT
jgi:hypothetical protein